MVSKIDGGLRSIFIKKLTPLGFHGQAIETGGTGLGVPDFNYCADGFDGWLEFKKTSAWAVSNVSPEQIGWILRRKRVGGRVFVGVRRQNRQKNLDEFWLIDGNSVGTLKEEGLKSKNIKVLGIWEGGPEKWDWTTIAAMLKEQGNGKNEENKD